MKIACPAKINLSLKVLGKRADGFHEIESAMQTIDLFDYLTIEPLPLPFGEEVGGWANVQLTGTSDKIPYDERNIVYRAAQFFGKPVKIHIEKNIPVAAGLAGGSTDAAGTLYGINKLLGEPFSHTQLHRMCAELGSDLNFCLDGGRALTKGRGEILQPLAFEPFKVSLIKPVNLQISAKEAYTEFYSNETANDLEPAMLDKYPQLQKIKKLYPNAVMSGSGPTYYLVNSEFEPLDGYWVKNNLSATPLGVHVCESPR